MARYEYVDPPLGGVLALLIVAVSHQTARTTSSEPPILNITLSAGHRWQGTVKTHERGSPYTMHVTRAIILFSHGSVLCGAGETLASLADHMRARGRVSMVEVGYLNYSEPSFGQAFERCMVQGATEIVVVPYFLVPGKFVSVDLPRAVATMRARHPQVEVRVAEAIGPHPLLADALIACAERARPLEAWRADLPDNSRFCRAHPGCPLYGTPRCPATGKTA